jgi:pimeloyl-ACP methyl ester carboxylesterase
MTAEMLSHNKVLLALHCLRDHDGQPLLVLHGLGERSPRSRPDWLAPWPGPVYALDFTGHGDSTVPTGGGYTCEVLMGDVDIALAHTGPATVLGRGLGAWIALLIAGGRPAAVRGAILADGPGLAGAGPEPASPFIYPPSTLPSGAPDRLAMAELSRDVRPPDYATSFARQATHLSEMGTPITVSAVTRPPWLHAVVGEPGVQELPLDEALAFYAN